MRRYDRLSMNAAPFCTASRGCKAGTLRVQRSFLWLATKEIAIQISPFPTDQTATVPRIRGCQGQQSPYQWLSHCSGIVDYSALFRHFRLRKKLAPILPKAESLSESSKKDCALTAENRALTLLSQTFFLFTAPNAEPLKF
jgi:hypothetical protein